MAKNKRQKVKHYHRSFYSRETRVKRGIGIVVLVAAVLAAAWFAAPHVLDWATHTWYTVVKDRDLEAESASRAEAAASSAAASSSAMGYAAFTGIISFRIASFGACSEMDRVNPLLCAASS